MSETISVNLNGVKPLQKRFSKSEFESLQYKVANQVLADMESFVPKRTISRGGALRASGRVEDSGKSITYNTAYARAQFYGTNGRQSFRHYSTPGTGKRWDLKATAIKSSSWAQIVRNALT